VAELMADVDVMKVAVGAGRCAAGDLTSAELAFTGLALMRTPGVTCGPHDTNGCRWDAGDRPVPVPTGDA